MKEIYTIEFTSPTSPASKFHFEYFDSDEQAIQFLIDKDYIKSDTAKNKYELNTNFRYKAYIRRFVSVS